MIDTSFAETLAAEIYAVQSKATALVGEYDKNFHLSSPQDEFTLKIMHAEARAETIELQIAALEHLANHAPDLMAPRVQRSTKGNLIERITTPDGQRLMWMLSYIPGNLYANVKPQNLELLESLGKVLAQYDKALLDFDHPFAKRELKWDLAKAGWIQHHLEAIIDLSQRNQVKKILDVYLNVQPKLSQVRFSVVHNDANDYNVVVDNHEVKSLIDFGDMLYTATINNLAIAAAYALMGQDHPLEALRAMVKGYHAVLPLSETELELLFPLIQTRLAVSVTNSAIQKQLRPDDPYVVISEQPAWDLLEKLQSIPNNLVFYLLRESCGLSAVPNHDAVVSALKKHQPSFAPILGKAFNYCVLDLTPDSDIYAGDPRITDTTHLARAINQIMHQSNANVAIGRYNESRLIYTSDMFARTATPTAERRTLHLGLDLFAPAGTPVHALLDGVVETFANNTSELDYGPVIVLRHELEGQRFYTLYGHLSLESLQHKHKGQVIKKGELFASLGDAPINGNWPPHLHLQILLDDLGLSTDFPGVAYPSERELFKSLCPDPNLLLGLSENDVAVSELDITTHIKERKQRIGRNLSISYHQPILMSRSYMQYMIDHLGQRYLDMYNNVPHVGHNHPHVVRAATHQLKKLNTNTRYLNPKLLKYAERLTAKLPKPLSVMFMTASGSEANELAVRLARAYTGNYDMVVMTSGYHGHTSSMIDISQYKFGGPGGKGAPEWVHLVPVADCYRGEYRYDDSEAGKKYAESVKRVVAEARTKGRSIAGFICESYPSVGGQIELPRGYLRHVYQHIHDAGGVCIADEVQTGFGRLGKYFWGFEQQEVIPDIVVMGKPIGNGYPMGAVITTPEIADAFNNGMEFFSTFGGNSVACAVGLAVLEVLEREGLQQHALEIGDYLLENLRPLINQYLMVGDVRGSGLFMGLELVRNRETLEPADTEASYVANRMRDFGILLGTDGPYHNVVKMRGPMPFNKQDADYFLECLNKILKEDPLQL
jgi:4-aminobutyrate aminotransferase-like enzyme/Ser/Thr protein kinase RdoA (MazF antagonist)